MSSESVGGLKTVYVGGFGQDITDAALFATFATFGDVVSVNLPTDQSKRHEENPPHRGFGYVEFGNASDALDAVDNMHLNQINGKTLKVNLSKPKAGAEMLGTNRSVWENEDWVKANLSKDVRFAPCLHLLADGMLIQRTVASTDDINMEAKP